MTSNSILLEQPQRDYHGTKCHYLKFHRGLEIPYDKYLFRLQEPQLSRPIASDLHQTVICNHNGHQNRHEYGTGPDSCLTSRV